jgi:hypothetical protein
MRVLGWADGQNIVIERGSAESQADRYPALVQKMVDLKVDVLVVSGAPLLGRPTCNPHGADRNGGPWRRSGWSGPCQKLVFAERQRDRVNVRSQLGNERQATGAT